MSNPDIVMALFSVVDGSLQEIGEMTDEFIAHEIRRGNIVAPVPLKLISRFELFECLSMREIWDMRHIAHEMMEYRLIEAQS